MSPLCADLLTPTPLKDMNRYPSTIIKVAFEGADVHEETLYRLFRVGPLPLFSPDGA